jgi:hypothetical protein
MSESLKDYREIFQTRKLVELYAAVELLEKNEIQFFMQEKSADGVRIAMPFEKFMDPGNLYSIFVHEETVNESKNILSNLPDLTGTKPNIWETLSNETNNRRMKVPWWFFLIILVVVMIVYFVSN